MACALAKTHDPTLQCSLRHFERNQKPCMGGGTESADRGCGTEVVAITFGDLVALAGDHFEDVADMRSAIGEWLTEADPDALDEIFEARDAQIAHVRAWLGPSLPPDVSACMKATPWLFPSVDVTELALAHCRQTLVRHARRAVRSTRPVRVRGTCLPVDPYELEYFTDTPGFWERAAKGADHFGDSAIRTWLEQATLAQGVATKPPVDPTELLFTGKSMLTAGFALHFFTDRYAAGHIRHSPDDWDLTTDEARRLHDYDNDRGLLVSAKADDFFLSDGASNAQFRWHAHGDKCLMSAGASEHRALLTLSVAAAILRMRGVTDGPFRGFFPADGLALNAAFPEPDDDANPPVPGKPDLWTLRLEPSAGAAVEWLTEGTAQGEQSYGATLGAAVVLDPHWPTRSIPSAMRLKFGLAARGVSTGQAVLGPLFAEVGIGSLDWLCPYDVRLLPIQARVGVVMARPSTEDDFFPGLSVSHQVRIEPPGRWSISVDTGGQLLFPVRDPSLFVGLGFAAEL